jgi:hypothetical protein
MYTVPRHAIASAQTNSTELTNGGVSFFSGILGTLRRFCCHGKGAAFPGKKRNHAICTPNVPVKKGQKKAPLQRRRATPTAGN